MPSTNTFVNTGLNQHPVFFGCDANARPNATTPIVIYVPNYPWSSASNTSTYQLEYQTSQALDIIANSARSVTLNNTLGADKWSHCLACAMADRAVARGGQERSQKCRDCFSQWCWDGKVDDSTPANEYEPIVGTVPEFLKNLGASATAAATPQSTQATGSSAGSTTNTNTSGAGRVVATWAMAAVGVLAGVATQVC